MATFWKLCGNFASFGTGLTKIWALCENISTLQSLNKNTKIVELESMKLYFLNLEFLL